MSNQSTKEKFNNLPIECKMEMLADLEGFSMQGAFDAFLQDSDDELDIDELYIVSAAGKNNYQNFLHKSGLFDD